MDIQYMDFNNIQNEDFKLSRLGGTDCYLFVHFKSPAVLLSDGEYVSVTAGNAVLFDVNQPQEYFAADNKKFVHDFILFNPNSYTEEILLNDIPKGRPFSVVRTQDLSNLFMEIKNEIYNNFSDYKEVVLQHLSTIFLYRIKEELQHSDTVLTTYKSYYTTLNNLRLQIYINPQQDWSIDKICLDTHLSASYLQHLYKSYFSVSIIKDVITARIERAKNLLLFNNQLSISEIAVKCGYNNTEHFIRQFKENTSLSPTKYLNSFKSKNKR